jgi:hypothetical protein
VNVTCGRARSRLAIHKHVSESHPSKIKAGISGFPWKTLEEEEKSFACRTWVIIVD